MKVHVFVIALALSAGAGLAAASVPLAVEGQVETPVDTLLPRVASPAPSRLALQPHALSATRGVDALGLPPLPAVELVALPAASVDPRHDALDAPPLFLLLPDGAIVFAIDPLTGAPAPLVRGFLARDPGALSVAPLAPRALPSGGLPAEGPNGGAASGGGPRGGADDAASTDPRAQANVFDPRGTNVLPRSAFYMGGGLAVLALAGAALLLYHRIRPNHALENETRKLIFDAVCASPGLGVHEVSRVAGVSYSTATYHLERLIGAGMIVMTPDGNKLCYYKNGGAFSENERKILPLVKNEEAAKLFEAIVDSPGTYRAALAERLGVTATTINWHLRRLREAGLVDETRLGRSAHLYARLDALRPTFLSLATKVEGAEPAVAQRLRKYAGDATDLASGGVGAA